MATSSLSNGHDIVVHDHTSLFFFFTHVTRGLLRLVCFCFCQKHLLETRMIGLVKFWFLLAGLRVGSFYENAEMIDEWHKEPVERSRG